MAVVPREAETRRARRSSCANAEALFSEYIKHYDQSVRDRLILEHQNLVHFLAGKFANRGIPLEDLVQVGMIGLINAVDRFDPERGIKFSTFATPTIVGEIRRHFRDKGWSVKVPRRLQELNLATSRAVDDLSGRLKRPPTVQEVAELIGASIEETLEAMELGNAYDTVSLDTPIAGGGGESGQLSLSEFLGEEDSSLRRLEDFGDLKAAMAKLEPRERAIIYYRYFKELSQSQVADRLGISQMHVSRLQQRALRRLKELLSAEG
jgi:RNA polymerase sigma-B factor